MRSSIVAGLLLGCVAIPAHAVTPSITFTNGVYTLPAFTTAQVFRDFETSPANAAYTPAPGETVSGDVQVRQQRIAGETEDTNNNPNDRYLSVESGGIYTVSFTAPLQFFSFIVGTLDSYNSLRLNFANGDSNLYTGRQIIGQALVGERNTGLSGRVNYDVGGQSGITSVQFSASDSAFELDGLAAAVPEASTWAMMMFGLGLAGMSLRSRRQKVVFAN